MTSLPWCRKSIAHAFYHHLEISDEDNGLRRRDLKPSPAAVIEAHKLVVDADHVVARLFDPRPVILAHVARKIALLYPLEPSNVVVISFAAKRTGIVRLFRLLSFVKNVPLLDHGVIVAKHRRWKTQTSGKWRIPTLLSQPMIFMDALAFRRLGR